MTQFENWYIVKNNMIFFIIFLKYIFIIKEDAFQQRINVIQFNVHIQIHTYLPIQFWYKVRMSINIDYMFYFNGF